MFNIKKKTLILYCLIWGLVFLVPYFNYIQNPNAMSWNKLIGDWVRFILLFIVFMSNAYYLVPKLLFNNKRSQYAVAVAIMMLLITVIDIVAHRGAMPHGAIVGMPLGSPHPRFSLNSILGMFFNDLITGVLVIGAGSAFELMNKWLSEEKIRKDAEKEQLKTSLALLRHQVSPHFFMNTLNNIHSLIEIDSEKAQNAVERLSTLMRYLLYDSAQNTIGLKKEIEFIRSFISLMQLRHSEEVKVDIVIPKQIPDVQIPPMLFISLLENAFKHGVSYPLKSYIYFELQFEKNKLICMIKNSKHKNTMARQTEYSGIGLDNIKESLKLLYENNYQLNILDKEDEFEVTLKIPI